MLGRSLRMWLHLPFNYSTSLYLHSLHHCPNIADQWRVILKAERLDYINASFVNVGIKHMYIQYVPSIMILCYLYAGLQAVQRVHCYTSPYEEHLSRLLEEGVWEGVWVDSDAVRPGRERRGDRNMMGLIHELQDCVASICIPSNICSDAPTLVKMPSLMPTLMPLFHQSYSACR